MPLDTLYKAGASAALTAAFNAARPGAIVQETSQTDGSVHVEATWGNEVTKLECYAEYVRFSYLSTTCGHQREADAHTYKALCAVLPQLLKGRGVKKFLAAPLDIPSKTVLKQHGGFVDIPGQALELEWVL